MTRERIRQIVSEVLQKRSVDSGADHAKLQLDRLAPLMQLAAEAVAAGDITAITPYLKVLDRLDRYQTVAGANQVYDDEARKKLMDKINRMAENIGIDEVMWAAAHAHLIKIGQIPPDDPDEADAVEDPAGPDESDAARSRRAWPRSSRRSKARRPTGCLSGIDSQPPRRVERKPDFFIWIRRNPLKSPDSAKGIQGNPSDFSLVFLLFLAPNSPLG